MVRLWRETPSSTSGAWRGEVEHIQTGERWPVEDLPQSLSVLTELVKQLDLSGDIQPVRLTP